MYANNGREQCPLPSPQAVPIHVPIPTCGTAVRLHAKPDIGREAATAVLFPFHRWLHARFRFQRQSLLESLRFSGNIQCHAQIAAAAAARAEPER